MASCRFQEMVSDEKPFTDRPNAHLEPIDFKTGYQEFLEKYGEHFNENDYLSSCFIQSL
ncbi:MAG: hypothetical protein R2769_12130 [Saprospiraceae bacterium]